MKHKILVLFTVLLFAGCNSGCKTTLEEGGAYKGDTFLFNVDQAIKLQRIGLNEFLGWEMQNHSAITSTWPQVTVAADKVRDTAPQMFALAGLARTSYIQVRSGLAGTNSLAVVSAQATLREQVNAISDKVSEAQSFVDIATLGNKPTLKNAAIQ